MFWSWVLGETKFSWGALHVTYWKEHTLARFLEVPAKIGSVLFKSCSYLAALPTLDGVPVPLDKEGLGIAVSNECQPNSRKSIAGKSHYSKSFPTSKCPIRGRVRGAQLCRSASMTQGVISFMYKIESIDHNETVCSVSMHSTEEVHGHTTNSSEKSKDSRSKNRH
jgi:hypothetical protein